MQIFQAFQCLVHYVLRFRFADPISGTRSVRDVREEVTTSAELQKYVTGR